MRRGLLQRSFFRVGNFVDVDRGKIVVPVVMRRPLVTLVTLRLPPNLPTFRALTLRIKGVPTVTTLARPLGSRWGFPFALRTVNLHEEGGSR